MNSKFLHVSLLNEFNLSPEAQAALLGYYKLHWQVQYLMNKIDRTTGTITHADVEYYPIYIGNVPANPNSQVMLSFRKIHNVNVIPAFDGIPNYVLIKAKN